MLPSIRQRLVIALAVLVTGLLYLRHAEAAISADGKGITLLGSATPTTAIIDFALVTLPGVALAGLAGSAGNPLGGIFALAAALVFAAVKGGSIDVWLRSAPSSAAYWRLLGETVMWMALWIVAAPICYSMGKKFRAIWPASWKQAEQWRDNLDRMSGSRGVFWGFTMPIKGGAGALMGRKENDPPLSDSVQLLGGMAVATAVGAAVAPLLLRSSDIWQVNWGLFFAFTAAGIAAHQIFPARNPMGILLSPFLAAIGWYAYIAISGDGAETMLTAFYSGESWHAGLALPIHYASAGVAGAAAGIGWSHGMIVTHPANPHQPGMAGPVAPDSIRPDVERRAR